VGGVDSPAESLEVLLRHAVERRASDVHLKVPSEPLMRVDGRLERIPGPGRLTPAQTEGHLAGMLAALPHSARQLEFEARGEVDFTAALPGIGRFRVNAYRQRGSVTLILRPVPFAVPQLDDLGLPAEVAALAAAPDGLVLVGGPAGSGVTTTIAALIDRMNDGPPRSVITIEDPIEVLHADRACAINQREVGLDTASVADGLGRVLRHDPDVVMVGALDDSRALEVALDAAANGVLVIAAMTTADPSEAVERLIAIAPSPRRRAVRAALAACLRAVVCQRLVAREDGAGRRAEARIVTGEEQVRRLVLAGAAPYVAAPPLEVGAGSAPTAIAVGSATATSR
jgi:twitching motility protein PilT